MHEKYRALAVSSLWVDDKILDVRRDIIKYYLLSDIDYVKYVDHWYCSMPIGSFNNRACFFLAFDKVVIVA